MKKYIILLSLMVLSFSVLSAQTPYWQWAKQAGGIGEDMGRGIIVDVNGNTYVTGYFGGTVVFGTQTLMSGGSSDIFVSKFDVSGNWLWTAQAGGTSTDQGCGINVDGSGNAYVCGSFMGTALFGTTQLISSGNADIYVAKIDTDGNWLWAKQAGGTGYDWATYTIGIDQNNKVYVTGAFTGTATFGTTSLVAVGTSEVCAASLDSDGNWLWAVQSIGTAGSYEYGCAIATATDGTTYITGAFTSNVSFGTTNLSTFATPDIYVAKLDVNGNWLWAVQAGDNTYFPDFGQAIGLDPSGNAYIGGYFMGTATFGTITLTSPGPPNCDIFVAKINSSGTWQWATMANGTGDDKINALSVDASGNAYSTGHIQNTVTFGTESATSAGNYDIFGAMIDTDGTWQWVQRAGGTLHDVGFAIALDSNANSYLSGYFKDVASFGDDITFTSNGEEDIFIAKLSSDSIIGDFNGDGYVDASDLQLFGDHWHYVTADPGWDALYDLDPDGIIDAADLQIFGDHWHEGIPPTIVKGDEGKGPNVGAGIEFDLDALTSGNQHLTHILPQAAGTYIRLDVYATAVHNLDTYEFEVVYDASELDYISSSATNPITFEGNILTSEGGTAVGWMVDDSTPGILSIAYTLTGTDTLEAPDGDGLLGDIVFQALETTHGTLSFGDVYYYDTFGVSDLITDTGTATLPVELSAFTATYNTTNGYTTLAWTTASENDVIGFNVYRSTEDEFDTSKKINAGIIAGHGTTTELNTYEFIDLDQLNFGTTYYYWLESVEFDGISIVCSSIDIIPEEGTGGFVDDFEDSSLSNRPNPFKSSTTIVYSVKGMLRPEPVEINIYNMLGQLVDTVEGKNGTATWNTNDHATGIYFYKLNIESYSEIRKMMVTK